MKAPHWFSPNRYTSIVRFACAGTLITVGLTSAILALPLRATSGSTPAAAPHVVRDTAMQALSTTIGGATVLPTTRTVAHWFRSTLDPNNGVTYGYNMVGADPNNCSGASCD